MGKYGKLLWAVVGAVVFFLQAALRDGMTADEWVGVIIAAANVVVVYLAQDTDAVAWVKSAVGGVLMGLLILQTAITGGLTSGEWMDILVAVLTGAGVVMDPRRPVHALQIVAPSPRSTAY